MRIFIVLLSLCALSMTAACAQQSNTKKSGWFFGMFRPYEWPAEHWEGQTYQPNINKAEYQLPAALDRNRSMFDPEHMTNVSPDQFIQNLKNADIIETSYQARTGFLYDLTGAKKYDNQTGVNTYDVVELGDIVVELDYNFYTLAKADQVIISELLTQAYDRDYLILKDTHTHKIVGHVKENKLTLF